MNKDPSRSMQPACTEFAAARLARARGEEKEAGLEAHLRECPACRAEVERQGAVTEALRGLAASARSLTAPTRVAAVLSVELAQRRGQRRRRAWWATAAGIAAAAALVGMGWREAPRWRPAPPGATIAAAARSAADSSAAADTVDFVSLGDANPPASGVVVTMDLPAGALRQIGVPVDAGIETLPAEVLLGEDGVPRGIRVAASDLITADADQSGAQ